MALHGPDIADIPASAYTPRMDTADEPSDTVAAAAEAEVAGCPYCLKPPALCVCDGIEPIDNKIALVIVQHPQEQDRTLGTARLTTLHFKNAMLKIGLSWSSLNKIVGGEVDPQRWAILYLGSVKATEIAPEREVIAVDRKGNAEEHQGQALRDLEGVILLDGTWSQAKALWWRNAWMLKCQRVVLNPKKPSRYGNLRKEPRSDGLSTIESAALLLSRLEKRPEIETVLDASFEKMLTKYRESGIAPKPHKIDRRRKNGVKFRSKASRLREGKPKRA
jgi:DTW domain-containing protein YfiP